MASGFGNTTAGGNTAPVVKTHFKITDNPRAHEKYTVIEPLQARIDPEITAAVTRRTDGRPFLRVFYPGVRNVGEGYYHGPGRLRQKLEILQQLRHSNITKIEEAVTTNNGDAGTVYEEILDLGEVTQFADTNSLGVGYTEQMPIAFGWHVLLQGLRAICYLTYGYSRFREVIESSDVAPGWDPVIHNRIFDGSNSNFYLKTSGKGKYPTVVLRGFEECRQESEYVTYSAQAPDEAFEAFAYEQRNDLFDFIRFVYRFLRSFDPLEAIPLRQLLKTFHTGHRVPRHAASIRADARQMARAFEEAFLEHKVIQADFPGPLLQPAFTNALHLGGDLAPWKRGKRHAVLEDDLTEHISPAGMKFPKSGVIMPEFGAHLRELEKSQKVNSKHRITATIANSYLIDQLAKDREATRRYYPMDKILRDTARLDYKPARPFKLVDFLGKGGFGSVTLWSRRVPEPYKRKMTTQNLAIKDSRVTYNFERDYNAEFYLTRRLNRRGCKNVVKIYDHAIYRSDLDTRKASFRMALEYCKYGSLSELIRFYELHGLALPECFVWQVVSQVASTLTCCENGTVSASKIPGWDTIVHLDLKPQNVLLQRDENSIYKYPDSKLADFGLACALPNDEIRSYKSTYNVGTPGYKDPALADGKPMSSKADIYSFGRMMKSMVETFYSVLHDCEVILNNHTQYLTHPVDLYYPCKKSLVDLIHKCMHRDPDKRPTAYEIYWLAQTEIHSDEMKKMRRSRRSLVLTSKRRRTMWLDERAYHGLPRKKEWYAKNQKYTLEVVALVRRIQPTARTPVNVAPGNTV